MGSRTSYEIKLLFSLAGMSQRERGEAMLESLVKALRENAASVSKDSANHMVEHLTSILRKADENKVKELRDVLESRGQKNPQG